MHNQKINACENQCRTYPDQQLGLPTWRTDQIPLASPGNMKGWFVAALHQHNWRVKIETMAVSGNTFGHRGCCPCAGRWLSFGAQILPWPGSHREDSRFC